jgi:predicted AAA+ superfamily ATPase
MRQRHITSLLLRSLESFPAVLVNGARQVGKSTLIQQLKDSGIVQEYITLDDLSTLEVARTNPEGLISRFTQSVAIDEIQRAPELLIAIKKSIDSNRKPGRFLLTGSANILSLPAVTESLAGRMDIITLEGLSVGELLNKPAASSFVEDLFSGLDNQDLMEKWQQDLQSKPKISTKELAELIFYGGFPEIALKKDPYFATRWFSAYQTAYVERDVRDLNRLLDVVSFGKLFRLVGLQSGSLMNVKNLCTEVGLDQRTVARYLEILEITFQVHQLQPWFSNIRKRLIKTPKVYMNDSGQMTYLAGIGQPDLLLDHHQWGHLAETWAWSEIRKLLHLSSGIQSFFYRTHLGKEVDFVLTKGSTIWGIECKATETLTHQHSAGLEDMQATLGPKARGVILYLGDTILPFSENLIAVPLRMLA